MLALLAATLLAAGDVPTGAPSYTFRIELQGSGDAPLGNASLSGVYGPAEWLSLGAGIGVSQRFPNVGLFARWHAVRLGALKLGPAVAATRGARRRINEGDVSDFITYTWEPAYRLDVGVGVEARRGRLSARLDGGVGYLPGQPECLYLGGGSGADSCGSPFIPPQFREVPASAQMPLYLAVAIGIDLQPSPAVAATGGGGPARETWYGGWAVAADVAAAALTGVGIASDQAGMAVAGGAAYLLGGPVNHLAHHQRRKAGGSVGLRVAGGVATLLTLSALKGCADSGTSCNQFAALLPVGPLVAMIVDDVVIARAAPAP